MENLIQRSLLVVVLGLLFSSAQATIVYNVTSTNQINCASSPHGLWTNNDYSATTCGNYFDIAGTFTIDNSNTDSALWTASLMAVATNPAAIDAFINLNFGGYTEDHTAITNIKNGGGGNPADWSFFTSMSGSILFSDFSTYDFVAGSSMVDGYAFQYGLGANDKTYVPGGSAWIQSEDMSQLTASNPMYHWDLNLDFEEVSVPEPATLALMGLGIMGFGFGRRKTG